MLTGPRLKLLKWVRPIHHKLRHKKIDLFLKLSVGSAAPANLLDVGGGLGVDGEFAEVYSHFSEIVVANLAPSGSEAPAGVHIDWLAADGRCLPFGSKSFDWVFSNAVIEHVGRWDDQRRFANEIRRVAVKGYFVTTPNRYFPLEQHTLLPLLQFFPRSVQNHLAQHAPGYRPNEEINLLSSTQMRALFPEARVISTGFPVIGNSLVAFYREGQNS